MTYLQFLGQWYNLPWLAAVGAGLWIGFRAGRGRRAGAAGAAELPERPGSRGPSTSPATALVTAGVVGLTLNGAIHDLRLGSAGTRFPLVALLSLAVGWFLAWGGARLRYRLAPPVTGLAFNRPGLEGSEAVVTVAGVAVDGTVRARLRDDAGVAHIVRVQARDGQGTADLRFGSRIRLGAFDAERGSYDATPL